jgi:hypothetical protein
VPTNGETVPTPVATPPAMAPAGPLSTSVLADPKPPSAYGGEGRGRR